MEQQRLMQYRARTGQNLHDSNDNLQQPGVDEEELNSQMIVEDDDDGTGPEEEIEAIHRR